MFCRILVVFLMAALLSGMVSEEESEAVTEGQTSLVKWEG